MQFAPEPRVHAAHGSAHDEPRMVNAKCIGEQPIVGFDHDLSEVRPRREAIPAVDVDADEDRFHEEGEAFDREAEPEDAAEGAGEVRPEQPHLEAEDRPGHDASGE